MEAGGLPNCRLRPPPGVFWFLFHVEKELARRAKPFLARYNPIFYNRLFHRPLIRLACARHLPPKGKGLRAAQVCRPYGVTAA